MAFVMPGILNPAYLGEWGAGLYPNSYEPASLVALVTLLPIMGVFYLFSVSMPRSGGDYIYVSRSLAPVLGLITSWSFSVVFWSWAGFQGVVTFTYGPALELVARGEMAGNQGLINLGLEIINNPWLLWTLATLHTLVMGYIIWRGTRATVVTMYVVLVLSTIGLLAMSAQWLLMPGLAFFKANMLQMTGVSYDSVISLAGQNGLSPGFSILPTIYAGVTYVMLNTLGNQGVATVAGEMKQVRRATFLALFGSVGLMALYWLPQYLFVFELGGREFTTASAYLFQIGKNPFIVEPEWLYLTAIAGNNPALLTIYDIGYMVSSWAIGFGALWFSTRAIFAWGFDRVFPSFANKVNSRGVPVGAVVIATLGGWLWTTANVWFPQFIRLIGYTTCVWALAWVILGFAAIAFPYRRKDIFDKSPDVVRRKALGLPLIVHMGWMTVIIGAFIAYATFLPAITGTNVWYSFTPFVATVTMLMLIPVAIFYAYYFYRKRVSKIPMDIQFKEIPPD
jgi:amino acid transporter